MQETFLKYKKAKRRVRASNARTLSCCSVLTGFITDDFCKCFCYLLCPRTNLTNLSKTNSTMKKQLLFAAMTAMMLLPTVSQAQSENASTLISNNIEVKKGSQYRMIFKDYSSAVYEYLKDNPRIAVEFITSDGSVVQSGGAWFKGLQTGETDMSIRIYAESPKWKDMPDYNKLLEEVPFHVTIKDEAPVTPPAIFTEWGKNRQDARQYIAQNMELTEFTDTYLLMHPTMLPEEIKPMDVYIGNNFEFPLYFAIYNDDDQLVSTVFTVVNFDRVGQYDKSELCTYFKNNGYEFLGVDENKWFVMYNEKTQTQVVCGILTVQGQWLLFCQSQYSEQSPLGIEDAEVVLPQVGVRYDGNVLEVDAGSQAGQPVVISTTDGQCLVRDMLKPGINRYPMPHPSVVVVRAGNAMGIKVMP